LTTELRRFIREARTRIQGIQLSTEEELDQKQAEAIRDFTDYLAARVNLAVRIELMFGASYFWNETGPAVRFTIDDQSFLLMQEGEDCRLFLNVEGDEVELASLLGDDPSYEDKLLIVIGDVLEKHNLLMA
jgi:hypothetical protein